jgi:uncharacterized protein YaiL (DUF2058 family)
MERHAKLQNTVRWRAVRLASDAAISAAASQARVFRDGSMRRRIEMTAQARIDLVNGRFRGRHMAERVQRYEIVNRAVVPNRIDRDARLL